MRGIELKTTKDMENPAKALDIINLDNRLPHLRPMQGSEEVRHVLYNVLITEEMCAWKDNYSSYPSYKPKDVLQTIVTLHILVLKIPR